MPADRLTPHDKDGSNMNVVPALSPTGDKVSFIIDRSLSTGLYLASAIDGRMLGRLSEGERRAEFESFRFFSSSADWSPDGKELAVLDLYNPAVTPTSHSWGLRQLSAGKHLLRFECAGKAEKSKGYLLGFDALAARIPVYARPPGFDIPAACVASANVPSPLLR